MLCAEELTDGGIDDGDGSAAFKSPIRRLGSTRKILYFNNIRLQLNEHLRCLDSRVEAQVSLVSELQDYFRKRAEVEMDYSKSLDKLAKSLQMRHKEQKPKREQWSLFTSYSCWQQLVLQTKNLSKDHGALGELYSTHLVSRLSQVTEDVQRIYKRKLRDYLMRTSRIYRLDVKQQHIETLMHVCCAETDEPKQQTPQRPLHKPMVRRKRIGRLQMNGQPKLFGGSLEEYLDATNQEIPLIVKSCVRVINLYGLHHQGIFRVSGSQVEINNFKDAFERGEDPLADTTDASDINSVAGVLKLYLRELREPLFPIIYFEQFMELAQLESRHQFVLRIKELIQSFPSQVVVVLRYLFAFLNHLSEFSDENMMDVYNLAICFGPTLVPVPEEKDQVQYQNLVNDLIKNIILFHEDIFPSPSEIGGLAYEKYISREPDDVDVGDSPSDHAPEDVDSEVYPSEDECESLEATAQYDFVARSERELSFKKGATIALHSQVSGDWWRGSVNGREGLIPDKYILLKIRDEDREKPADACAKSIASSSDDSTRRRTSSSNDSALSGSAASGYSSPPLLQLADVPWPPAVAAAAAVQQSRGSPRHDRRAVTTVADAPVHEVVLETTV